MPDIIMKINDPIDANEIIRLRLKVRETAISLGGYWRPLSAIARVLEELGEVGELLVTNDPDRGALVTELADLFVITTCIADQYCATVEDALNNVSIDDTEIDSERDTRPAKDFCQLALCTGRLGRLINHLEGDKSPKPGEPVSSVTVEVARIQKTLFRMADAVGANLITAVDTVLEMNARRDRSRFKFNWDPSTALSRERFNNVIGKSLCPFAQRAKIWGAPDIDDQNDLAHNILRIAEVLRRFCRVAPSEGLDGFVIRLHAPAQLRNLTSFSTAFQDLANGLGRANTAYGMDNPMEKDISSPEWRFTFGGVSFFITTFAPFYRGDHPRFSWCRKSAFIFMQPEFSFDHHGIHSGNPKRGSIKESIRQGFARNSAGYSPELVDQPFEALKYIKPLQVDDPPVRWWRGSNETSHHTFPE